MSGIPDWSNPKVTNPVVYDGHRFHDPIGAARYADKQRRDLAEEQKGRTQDFDQLRLLGENMNLARLRMNMQQTAEYERRARFQQRLDLIRSRAAGYRISGSALPNNLRNLGY